MGKKFKNKKWVQVLKSLATQKLVSVASTYFEEKIVSVNILAKMNGQLLPIMVKLNFNKIFDFAICN